MANEPRGVTSAMKVRLSHVLVLVFAAVATSTAQITITTQPARPLIEKTVFGQELHVDFRVESSAEEPLVLRSVEVKAFDKAGKLQYARFIDSGGFSPAILTIPHREVKRGMPLLLFNPIHTFPSYLDTSDLRYKFEFTPADKRAAPPIKVDLAVRPINYEPKTLLLIPLKGLVLVGSGHDFLAHHRRYDYLVANHRIGFPESNFMRQAWDMYLVDEKGNKCRTSCGSMADYYGYGAPVRAPADGTVVRVVDGFPDDFGGKNLSLDAVRQNPNLFFGNFVAIKHADKEFSFLDHLRPGSIRVRPGDRVMAGQQIAQVGCSGSAEEPHLHWDFRDSPDVTAEGVPAHFRDFERVIGSKRMKENRAGINSGELVQSTR